MNDRSTNRLETWVLALTSVSSFMVVLDSQVVATALSAIRGDLRASMETLEWTVNAYNLAFAVLLLTGSALGDRFGRRRIFVAGIGVFVLSSAAAALSQGAAWLIAARAFQGAGAALIMPLAMALLSATFQREARSAALGIFSGVTGLALIVGPLAGGAITATLTWQWIFWINVPLGAIVIALVLRYCPESRGAPAPLDAIGLALVTLAALAVVLGLMQGNDAGWTSAPVVSVIAAGLLLASGFVVWERRARAPMVPMRLFAARAFSAGVTASFLFYAGMCGVLFFLPQFFQSAQGADPLGAGLRLLPWTATLFVFAPIGGSLVKRFGERRLVSAGLFTQAIGFAWIALIATPELAFAQLVAPLLIAGAGVSLAMPASQNAVLSAVAPAEIGKASGSFNMARFLGGVFGVALLVAVFDAHGSTASLKRFSDGFRAAILVSALLSLAGALAARALPGKAAARLTSLTPIRSSPAACSTRRKPRG